VPQSILNGSVADMAVQSEASDVIDAAGPYDRAKALSAFKFGDITFYWITRVSAISVLLILGGIIVSLIIGAWPAMREYGFAFLWTQRWAPSADPPVLGALAPMYGRALPAMAAPPDRDCDRVARRHPLDHLRHVGLLRARAVPRL
jgi:phosphate transport system permease protein